MVFDSEWKFSSPIVDTSCRWPSFRARTHLVYRKLNCQAKDYPYCTNGCRNDNGECSLPAMSGQMTKMLFKWVLVRSRQWKSPNGVKTSIFGYDLGDEVKLETAWYHKWLDREKLFCRPLVVSNHNTWEDYCLFIRCWRTDATMLSESSENFSLSFYWLAEQSLYGSTLSGVSDRNSRISQ
jgi:hypothetical protein